MESSSANYIEFIKSRKSIRHFIFEKVDQKTIKEIIECARWAPSGQNNQPWKVCAVSHPTVKRLIAEQSKYGGLIESAYFDLVIFMDLGRCYDRTKDLQSLGAFIENVLLGVHAKKLGAVWIGEILTNKEKVNEIFKLSLNKYELMCVIAIGVIDKAMEAKSEKERERRDINEFLEFY
jgi:nitroreductase